MLWFIFPPCLHVCLHFLLLFPVSQWKTQRVRPKGVSFGSKLNRTQLKKKKSRTEKKEKHWQVFNKFDAFMIAGESVWCSWLPPLDLLGLGKRNEAAGRYEVCLLSRSLCEPVLSPRSLSLRQQKSERDAAAQSTLPVRGARPAAYIVQCKRKLDLITALC